MVRMLARVSCRPTGGGAVVPLICTRINCILILGPGRRSPRRAHSRNGRFGPHYHQYYRWAEGCWSPANSRPMEDEGGVFGDVVKRETGHRDWLAVGSWSTFTRTLSNKVRPKIRWIWSEGFTKEQRSSRAAAAFAGGVERDLMEEPTTTPLTALGPG